GWRTGTPSGHRRAGRPSRAPARPDDRFRTLRALAAPDGVVQRADAAEDLVGRLLLLVRRRVMDLVPPDRVAVADPDLREAAALPVAHVRRAVDGDGDHRRARLEGEPPDAALGPLGELARARAPAPAVHADR